MSLETSVLEEKLRKSIENVGLARISENLLAVAQPAVLFELFPGDELEIPIGDSKIGGAPDLPSDYLWPQWKNKPMGFIGQINLATVSKFDSTNILPKEGVLSFFYDLYEQPWGYDPKKLGFSRVEYFHPAVSLTRREQPDNENRLKCSHVAFSPSLTIPDPVSPAFIELKLQYKLNQDEIEMYPELRNQLLSYYRQTKNTTNHHLLGFSDNIQNDMQFEAERVTNGFYCGDASGYNDPMAKNYELSSTQWQLLFQLDSDEIGEFMWGDGGMLYYWIRKSDLLARDFTKHWMTVQCY